MHKYKNKIILKGDTPKEAENMIIDEIKPEIYTFIDFTKHGYEMGKRRGLHSLSSHLGGEIPQDHPLPYYVYSKVRDFLIKNPKAIDEIKECIREELEHPSNGFKKVDIEVGHYIEKKGLFKKIDYPQINVTVEW